MMTFLRVNMNLGVMMKTMETTNKNQVLKEVSKRMKEKSKNQIRSKIKNLTMMIKKKKKEPTETATRIVYGEGNDTEMTEAQQGNGNLETIQEQVVEDAHVTISTISKKTKVPVTSSSRSSDLASKFLKFSNIPQTDAEIVSPLDVHVHHEVPRTQEPTLLIIPVLVIPESSSVFTNIP
ncbi:hypothetical protein Tco_1257346 [Tanacetum coccineum]